MLLLHLLHVLLCPVYASGFQTHPAIASYLHVKQLPSYRSSALKGNIYDDWAQDLLSTTQSSFTYEELQMAYCDEEAVEQCLEEFMDSDYGKTMFGRHDLPASVGQVMMTIQQLYDMNIVLFPILILFHISESQVLLN